MQTVGYPDTELTSGVDEGVVDLSLVGEAGAKIVHDDVLMDVVMLCLDDLFGEFLDGKLNVFVHSARLRPMSDSDGRKNDDRGTTRRWSWASCDHRVPGVSRSRTRHGLPSTDEKIKFKTTARETDGGQLRRR